MEEKRMTVLDYYTNLFSLLRNDEVSFLVTVEDIYREIKNLNESLGFDCSSANLWQTKQTFLKIFDSYIKESSIDTTHKRRGTRMIYLIEVKPSDIVGLDLKLKKAFPSLNRAICKGPRKAKTEKAPVVKKSVIKEEKIKHVIPGKRLPRKDWLFRFYELVKIANASSTGRLSKKQIKTAMSLKNIQSMNVLIDSWRSTLMRGGIVANFSLYKNLKNDTELIITNCPGLIRDIGLKYKQWFGIDLKSDEVLNISTSIPVEKVIIQPKKVVAELPFEIAYTIYAIGGICKNRESVVSYEVLYKLLKEHFSIKITRNEIIELVRKEAAEYLEVCNQCGGGIKLKNTINWEDFSEKFSPMNFKNFTYARIGMTLEEVKKIVPSFEIEVVTEFTSNDAVYKIVYDKSIHSLRSLCILYRTFRGADKLFDEELTKMIENEIVCIDSRSYVGNLAFEIES